MYHMGVIKALLENGAMPGIISGTSGGAIVAGVLGIHTDAEMLHDVIADDIAVRRPDRAHAVPASIAWGDSLHCTG